jgi:hypothetical protein
MALGSWTGIYGHVIEELMDQRKEQELLLLLAIQKHCDPFGFCFPGRAKLKRLRHCGDKKFDERMAFLEGSYIVTTQTYNARRRQYEPDYQVSPRVLYVRSEIQEYCEMIFDGVQERDFALEKNFIENILSLKESQPEALPESGTRRSKPASGTSPKTRQHNQLRNGAQNQAQGSTMRNGAQPENSDSNQRRPAQPREENPVVRESDEFHTLLSPDVDDDQIADEIRLGVGTSPAQAADAVATYPREELVYWLEQCARRRQKGTVGKPGGWFFTMLKKHARPKNIPGPNGQFDTSD